MTHEDELAIAKAATPGPWDNGAKRAVFKDGQLIADFTSISEHGPERFENAAFVAHFSPDRVLEMLEELKLLRQLRAAAPKVCTGFGSVQPTESEYEALCSMELTLAALRAAKGDGHG